MEIQNNIIDGYSVIHFLTCFCLASIIKKREVAYPLLIFHEIFETPLFVKLIPVYKNAEGPVNICSDMAVNLIAWELGRKYGSKKI